LSPIRGLAWVFGQESGFGGEDVRQGFLLAAFRTGQGERDRKPGQGTD